MGHELRVRIKTLVMILVMVLCANVGDLMLKRGMTQIGSVVLSPAGLEHAFLLTVTNGTQTSASFPIQVVQSAFGILSLNGGGNGAAALFDA